MFHIRAEFLRTHKRTVAALVFGLAFSVLTAYAVPPGTKYNPGDTLDPNCVPGTSNCTVDISGGSSPITVENTDSLFSTGLTGTGENSIATKAIFLGLNAGNGAINADFSTFLGYQAGYGATDANQSFFSGYEAGYNAETAESSNFFGLRAGYGATSANNANFLGASAGYGATGAELSNFFGSSAGYGATNASNSFFAGANAGNSATHAYHSIFIGADSGLEATYATRSNFFGQEAGYQVGTNSDWDGDNTGTYFGANFFGYRAGYQAANAVNANFIGTNAGNGAVDSVGANFIGEDAGFNADNASFSNFIGSGAGSGATDASLSNFIGNSAGFNAINAETSNFIGDLAGYDATNSRNSNFIGLEAGNGTVNAANSIFIGTRAGSDAYLNESALDNTASYDEISTFANTSILIGHRASTGGFSNSIAIGAYATNTATNQFMVGSSTRRINNLVFNGGTGNTCSVNAGTGISCSSDERLKTNIIDLSSVLTKLDTIRTVTYNWNSDPNGKTMIGFLAQNLQAQFPELVTQNIDGMLSVNYAQITPVLVEAIREINHNIVGIADLAQENNWRTSLLAWFADRANGITKLFAGEIETKHLCVSDESGAKTCLTKSQLDALLNNQVGQTIIINNSSVPQEPVPTDTTSEPTNDEIVESESSPQEVVPTEEPVLSEEPVSTTESSVQDSVSESEQSTPIEQ